jgi:hypothetical protein
MDLSPLILEPYFVYERYQCNVVFHISSHFLCQFVFSFFKHIFDKVRFLKLMEGIKQHTPQAHPDRANITKALQHLTRIRAVKDLLISTLLSSHYHSLSEQSCL